MSITQGGIYGQAFTFGLAATYGNYSYNGSISQSYIGPEGIGYFASFTVSIGVSGFSYGFDRTQIALGMPTGMPTPYGITGSVTIDPVTGILTTSAGIAALSDIVEVGVVFSGVPEFSIKGSPHQSTTDIKESHNYPFKYFDPATMQYTYTTTPFGPYGPKNSQHNLNPNYNYSGNLNPDNPYSGFDTPREHGPGSGMGLDGSTRAGGAHSPAGPTRNSDGWTGGGAKSGLATFSQAAHVSSDPTQNHDMDFGYGRVANGQERTYLDYLADNLAARTNHAKAYEQAAAKLEAEKLAKAYQQAQYQPAAGKLSPTQQAHIATADLSRILLEENRFFFTGSILAEGISGHDNASYNTAARSALAGDAAFHNGGSFFDAYEGAGGNRYSDAAYDAYENSVDSHLANNDFARAHSDWRADTSQGDSGNNAKPILIDLDGDGLEIVSGFENFTLFDTDDTGLIHRSSWAGAGDGVLFFDADGDGTISSARDRKVPTPAVPGAISCRHWSSANLRGTR